MTPVDLVIVSDGRSQKFIDLTNRAINSFRNNHKGKVILIEGQESVKYPNADVVIPQPKPFNYNECLNIGYEETEAEYVIFANNDVSFESPLPVKVFEKYDSVSPINPLWNRHNGVSNDLPGKAVGMHLTGWCIAVKTETMDKIEGFNTGVDFWYSDNIYAVQLDKAKLNHALIHSWRVSHHASKTLFNSKNISDLTTGQYEKYLSAVDELRNIDLAFVTIDNGVYDQYLGQSNLPNIHVIPAKKGQYPAKVYNEYLDKLKNRYICFIHSDVSCKGLVGSIERTVKAYPGYLIGAVGKNNLATYWSRKFKSFLLNTCDSCCIVVDKQLGLRFDDVNFNEYHLYVEAMCGEAATKGIGTVTMDINAFESKLSFPSENYFIHHSHTLNQKGCSWGNYPKYRALLSKLYPGIETT